MSPKPQKPVSEGKEGRGKEGLSQRWRRGEGEKEGANDLPL